MRWGVRRDHPRGGGKYIRGMKRDLTLLNEREYNNTRKTLARDVQSGRIDYAKYDRSMASAKDKYKQKRKDIKGLKQTKSLDETRAEFAKVRTKAMREIPHYKIKSGIKTVNKIISGIAAGSMIVATGSIGATAGLVGAAYGTGAMAQYAAVGASALASAGFQAGASHYIRTRVASRLT